jgi:hypothetical protein
MSHKKSAKNVPPDADLAAWCAALSTTTAQDTVPPGWHTTRELCALLKKSNTRVGELLREAVRENRCERKYFRVAAAGTVRPVPHYKLK